MLFYFKNTYKKQKAQRNIPLCPMNWFDNNDTVSYGFKRFHLKNETMKRKVKSPPSVRHIGIYLTVQFFFSFNIIIAYSGRIRYNCFRKGC